MQGLTEWDRRGNDFYAANIKQLTTEQLAKSVKLACPSLKVLIENSARNFAKAHIAELNLVKGLHRWVKTEVYIEFNHMYNTKLISHLIAPCLSILIHPSRVSPQGTRPLYKGNSCTQSAIVLLVLPIYFPNQYPSKYSMHQANQQELFSSYSMHKCDQNLYL